MSPSLRRPAVLLTAAAAVLAVALAPPAAAGVPALSLSVGDGELHARGAGVELPVSLDCPEGWTFGLGLQIVEKAGDALATANGQSEGRCDGDRQTVTLYMQPTPGPDAQAFRPGSASVVANLYVSEPAPPPEARGHHMTCPVGMHLACPPALFPAPQYWQPQHGTKRFTGTVELS